MPTITLSMTPFLYPDWTKAHHVLVRKTSCLIDCFGDKINIKTFVDRSTLKWVKSACASTVKVQSLFRVLTVQ